MYVNITNMKVQPGRLQELVDAIFENDEFMTQIQQFSGFKYSYIMEAPDNPEDAISMTVWEDEEAANAYFSAPIYREVVDDVLPFLTAPPVSQAYFVKNEFRFEMEGFYRGAG